MHRPPSEGSPEDQGADASCFDGTAWRLTGGVCASCGARGCLWTEASFLLLLALALSSAAKELSLVRVWVCAHARVHAPYCFEINSLEWASCVYVGERDVRSLSGLLV